MKYLVLFLLVMFSCNINADVTLFDYYLTLSEQQKQTLVNYCKLENFPENTSFDTKGDVCYYASFYINELMSKEEKTRYLLSQESIRYMNKACYYYKVSNSKINRINMCKETYKLFYENFMCHTSTSVECNLLKDYYLYY